MDRQYRLFLLALGVLVLVTPALAASLLWSHGSTEAVRACEVSSDGKVVVISSDIMHIFNHKGDLVATAWSADDVALGPKASVIVAATDEGVRGIASNGSILWTRTDPSAGVAVSGDGRIVATITHAGLLSAFTATGEKSRVARGGATGTVRDVAISKNGSVIIAIDDGGIRAFRRNMTKLWSVDLANPSAIAMNLTGDLVAVGDGGSVKFFDLAGERVARYSTGGRVRSLAMTPSANLTVAGADDGTITGLGPQGELLWDLSVGTRVNRVAISSSGDLIAAATADRRLRLLTQNGTPLWDAELPDNPVALSLSSDGSTVAVGCNEGTAYVFDTGAASDRASPKNTPDSDALNESVALDPPGSESALDGDMPANESGAGGAMTSASPTTIAIVDVNTEARESGAGVIVSAVAVAVLAVWAGFRRRD